MTALIVLIVATTASGQSRTPCPPKDEKLYTPNKTAMKAQIEKAEAFMNDMQAVLSDMRALDFKDQDNHFWGRVTEVRTIAGEAGRIMCSSINLSNKTLAKPCKAAQNVADIADDLKACVEGHATGCVGLVLTRTKTQLKKEKSKIDAELDDLSTPRGFPLPWDRMDIETTMKGAINDAKRAGVEVARGANKAATNDGATEAIVAGGKAAAILKGTTAGEEASAIVGSAAKIKETYAAGRELDEATRENKGRRSKLIQHLESRVTTASHKIAQFRAEVYAIDWGAMAKPEPNMTPAKQGECEDSKEKEEALDRLAKDGLNELDQLPPAAPTLHPIQLDTKMDGMAILGEVLGQAANLQQIYNTQKQLYPSQPPSSSQTHPNRPPAGQSFSDAQQNPTQCRTVTHSAKGSGVSTVQIVCGGNRNENLGGETAVPPGWSGRGKSDVGIRSGRGSDVNSQGTCVPRPGEFRCDN